MPTLRSSPLDDVARTGVAAAAASGTPAGEAARVVAEAAALGAKSRCELEAQRAVRAADEAAAAAAIEAVTQRADRLEESLAAEQARTAAATAESAASRATAERLEELLGQVTSTLERVSASAPAATSTAMQPAPVLPPAAAPSLLHFTPSNQPRIIPKDSPPFSGLQSEWEHWTHRIRSLARQLDIDLEQPQHSLRIYDLLVQCCKGRAYNIVVQPRESSDNGYQAWRDSGCKL